MRGPAALVRRPCRVYFSRVELARLELVRGGVEFSAFARERVLEGVPELPEGTVLAPEPEPAPEALPDPRECLVLPLPGDADASGARYHLALWPGGSAGTLTMVTQQGDALELDLVGVEVTARADGTREVRFTDRSQVRAAQEIPEELYG